VNAAEVPDYFAILPFILRGSSLRAEHLIRMTETHWLIGS
jgi:hypothetical protein